LLYNYNIVHYRTKESRKEGVWCRQR